MDQVLATAEVLELILLYLPPRDLLLSQRVNSTFRNTITFSQILQRSLFLTAAEPEESLIWHVRLNSFLNPSWPKGRLKSFPLSNGIDPVGISIGYPSTLTTPITWHVEIEPLDPADWGLVIDCEPGSWQHMYLSQPPIKIHMVVSWGVGYRYLEMEGATLGEVIKKIIELVDGWEPGSCK